MAYINGEAVAFNPVLTGVVNFKPLYDVLGFEPSNNGTPTMEELVGIIEAINSLGIANLRNKMLEVTDEATTVEIMSLIDNIESGGGNGNGGGVQYKSIVYNDDDTITLIETNGTEHTMACVYEDDKLVSVSYDDKVIDLTYKDDELVGIGETVVDLSDAPVKPELVVDYIESTGSQYIDTGYVANQNTRIKCKYQIVGYKGDFDTLFSDFTNVQYSHRYSDGSLYQLVKWGGKYTTYGSGISSSDITTLEVDNGTFIFTENGVTTTQTIGAGTELVSPYSLLLLCNRYYLNPSVYESDTCCRARLYYFKVYEGETLVRDFVPVIDDSGVICLYDNVTKAYFYNKGTGVFSFGAVRI